jgi:hypothetical protein
MGVVLTHPETGPYMLFLFPGSSPGQAKLIALHSGLPLPLVALACGSPYASLQPFRPFLTETPLPSANTFVNVLNTLTGFTYRGPTSKKGIAVIMSAKSKDLIPEKRILKTIIVIRGENVILDSDLARLYDVETRRLNEQIRRNIEKFPDDFMFQLTKEESENLKSQIATSSSSWGGRRKLPFVFTDKLKKK